MRETAKVNHDCASRIAPLGPSGCRRRHTALVAGSVVADIFKDIEDLPIAPGLKEDADSGMRFDSPGGRIVTAVAAGGGSLDAYRRFYETALPALGWKAAASGYQRDGEALLLEFVQRGERIEVRVRIVPQGSEKGR